jgi:dihydrofolate synthase/folylpolyglutamate synthase
MTDDFEGMISKARLSALVSRLKPAIEKYNRASVCGKLSFFEIATVIALVYFKEEKVDFAVLETGLGGRLDATNIVAPKVCVITPISYEHMDKLGRTLKKIALEKAGIIKSNSIVISAPQEIEALEVIRNKCREKGAKLITVINPGRSKIRLIGAHQLMNAAVAQAAVNALKEYDINVGVDSVRKGLYNPFWPGRCEVAGRTPFIVLDGAQNAASAAVLKKAIKENFHYKRLILILGVSSDKDIKGIAGEFYNLADKVILTKANNSRAANPGILAGYFRGKDKYITDSVAKAIRLAKRLAKKDDLMLVTGSLFVVGEARKAGEIK